MLRKEVNDLLTQTETGTPMGDLFRHYWIPALLASELPEDDCPPTRVKLLGERLIAFRDSKGRYGLMDEFCAHRGVSLWFGRNEEDGLRCPYHGWKYDYTGQCIEVPSEPEESGFCEKIKLKGYPLIKVGDVLWTHMGETNLHLQALAGIELAAGDGRRHRFKPRVLPALRRFEDRPAVPRSQGQQVQRSRQEACV
jgi:phthalate 4,5-dioxygenase oxygenase subunit